MSIQDTIHKQIVRNLDKIDTWFSSLRPKVELPFYSSYDIRDSGYKVTNVDANIYPAGFNNICPTDLENAGPLVKDYVKRHYGENARRILVLTEEHSNNPFYWDNVATIRDIISDAGLEVRIAFPRAPADQPFVMNSASRGPVEVHGAVINEGKITIRDFEPDVVVSNNDFSEFYAEWGEQIVSRLNPPRELGWYQRKKSTYFKHYNQLCTEFARIIEVDPWLLTVETELFENFDISDEKSRDQLALRVDEVIARLKVQHEKHGVKEEPFVFIKNNSGTYGLGVIPVRSGDDVRSLNYKSRKKMKAAKGGREIEEVIIQEGVRSIVRADGVMAEPAIYLIGCRLAGGFLRTHAEKGETESLNSPGAIYKRLCVSDLKVSVEGHPMENVYGWIAKIGVLAIGLETAEMGVKYRW